METVILISLVIKGNEVAAKHEYSRRILPELMTWLGETTPDDCKPGVGYPVGSLLHYGSRVK